MVTAVASIVLAAAAAADRGPPASAAAPADAAPLVERDYGSHFLAESPDGTVWLHDLDLAIRTSRESRDLDGPRPPPDTRLAPALARRFAPLVARIEDLTGARPAPRPRDGKSAIVVLHLHVKQRRFDPGGIKVARPIFEVVEARIIHAGIIDAAWTPAWEELAASVGEVFAASFEAPGAAKRLRIERAIEKGSCALGRMDAAARAPSPEVEAAVREADPGARIVGSSKRGGVWAGRLRAHAACLRIAPATPFPAVRPEATRDALYDALAASASPDDFIREVRDSWGEAGLDEDLFGSYPIGREVHAWEVEGLTAEEFGKVRALAAEEGKRRRRSEEDRGRNPAAERRAIPEWGVEMTRAPAGVLAEKLVLRGLLVDRELPGGARVPLRPGDLVLDYADLDDAGGEPDGAWPSRHDSLSLLGERARAGGTGGPLRAIRGSEVVVVSADGPDRSDSFDGCYLTRFAGRIWLVEPLVSLGMVGVNGNAPLYRLGPGPERALEALATTTVGASGPPPRFEFELPDAKGRIVLLDLDAKARISDSSWSTFQHTYDLVEARVRRAEFITPEWRRAWEDLDRTLEEIVERSRAAPGAEKRARLAEAVGRGTAALAAMARARETAEMRAALARIEPAARIVHFFARGKAAEWGGRLRECAEALRIEPSPPFPPPPPDALRILVDAASAAEFTAKLRDLGEDDALEDTVLWSGGRAVSGREFEGLAPDRFAALRGEGRKAIEDRQRTEEARAKRARPPADSWEAKEWGVRLRPADAETLAKALALRATVVEGVLPGGSPIGLEPGDLIIDYERAHDLIMGSNFGGTRRILANRAELGGVLPVIRGDRLLSVTVSGHKSR